MFGAGWKLSVLWGGCVGWRRGGWSAECFLWDEFRVPLARSWRLPICHAESLVAGIAIAGCREDNSLFAQGGVGNPDGPVSVVCGLRVDRSGVGLVVVDEIGDVIVCDDASVGECGVGIVCI
jgi:hypothetical protein